VVWQSRIGLNRHPADEEATAFHLRSSCNQDLAVLARQLRIQEGTVKIKRAAMAANFGATAFVITVAAGETPKRAR
jgi:hypothetical protein